MLVLLPHDRNSKQIIILFRKIHNAGTTLQLPLSSFKSRTLKDWDNLPIDTVDCIYLPTNVHAQNMFSHDVKRLRIRCQTLKFSHPNVKFPRQSECSWFTQFAVSPVKKCEENLQKSLHLHGKLKK